jgi:hypothetical protein
MVNDTDCLGSDALANPPPCLCRDRRGWLDKASSLKRRVANDFSFDEAAAARLTLGLGDSQNPGFSLFTMPMVSLGSGLPQVGYVMGWEGV